MLTIKLCASLLCAFILCSYGCTHISKEAQNNHGKSGEELSDDKGFLATMDPNTVEIKIKYAGIKDSAFLIDYVFTNRSKKAIYAVVPNGPLPYLVVFRPFTVAEGERRGSEMNRRSQSIPIPDEAKPEGIMVLFGVDALPLNLLVEMKPRVNYRKIEPGASEKGTVEIKLPLRMTSHYGLGVTSEYAGVEARINKILDSGSGLPVFLAFSYVLLPEGLSLDKEGPPGFVSDNTFVAFSQSIMLKKSG